MSERPSSLTYNEIESSEVRVKMRVGEILHVAALRDRVFLKQLERKEILPSEFSPSSDLLPAVVISDIQEVAGEGGAIRILGSALADVDGLLGESPDRYLVERELVLTRDKLRSEYRQSKKVQR